ncbi:MAG: hypothetical protein ACW98J_11095 [Candidatus Thorarchaeota archaeon]
MTIAMALIAVFLPFLISITPVSDSIYMMASAWMLGIERGQVRNVSFGPMEWAAMAPITLLRLIFVFQIFRYYGGKTTRKRTVIVGALIESPLWISFIIFILPNLWGITISLPLPFLFIAGVLIVLRYPHHEEEDKYEGWW